MFPESSCTAAASICQLLSGDVDGGYIQWTDHWPEGARVPRVDPRVTQ